MKKKPKGRRMKRGNITFRFFPSERPGWWRRDGGAVRRLFGPYVCPCTSETCEKAQRTYYAQRPELPLWSYSVYLTTIDYREFDGSWSYRWVLTCNFCSEVISSKGKGEFYAFDRDDPPGGDWFEGGLSRHLCAKREVIWAPSRRR